MGYSKHGSGDRGQRVRGIRRVLWVVLVLNLGVALAKYFYGLYIGSVAMQADGFHSLFDGTSNVVGLVGIALACKPADRDHPYGHGKYETYASAAIGAMLVIAGWNVGSTAIRHLAGAVEHARVDALSFGVMVVTLVVNLSVTTYEHRMGKKLSSDILIADARHTRSDMVVSLGVIAGLIAVRLGYPLADPVIALLVAGAILWTAWRVFKDAGDTLSDTTRIPSADVSEVACAVPGVLGCHTVRTRGSEAEVYVDMHIQVDPRISVSEGHQTAELVERTVAERFEQVVDVIVHLEPQDEYQRRKTAEQIANGTA